MKQMKMRMRDENKSKKALTKALVNPGGCQSL